MDKDFLTEGHGTAKFVVDCQILAEMANAQVPVKREVIRRTINNICDSIDNGMSLKDVASPVEWRPR